MRRIVLSLAVMAVMTLLVSGVALALPEVVGTARDDTIKGTAKAEAIRALAGNDDIYARGGNDTVNAGRGNDRVVGGPGNDRIFGGPGNDRISGGPGNDRINTAGDQAKDAVYCGTGYDTVVANEHDRIEGTPAKAVVLQGLKTACEKVVLRP
jgi:Ca2+-binding RTX toxin-like protein